MLNTLLPVIDSKPMVNDIAQARFHKDAISVHLNSDFDYGMIFGISRWEKLLPIFGISRFERNMTSLSLFVTFFNRVRATWHDCRLS
jgi:hypothetical protein